MSVAEALKTEPAKKRGRTVTGAGTSAEARVTYRWHEDKKDFVRYVNGKEKPKELKRQGIFFSWVDEVMDYVKSESYGRRAKLCRGEDGNYITMSDYAERGIQFPMC